MVSLLYQKFLIAFQQKKYQEIEAGSADKSRVQ